MAWRVCRILDFKMDCTSIHGTEEMAKFDTGNHLASLITRLEEDLPKYAGIWNYPKYHPGFVEDIQTTIHSIVAYLQDQEVWAAYDDWQHFMNTWEDKIDTPMWAQIGTVIVEGPGPTVQPIHDPSKRIKVHPSPVPIKPRDPAREMELIWHKMLKAMALDVLARKPMIGDRPATLKEVLDVIERLSKEIDIGEPLSTDAHVAHWMRLIWKEALDRFKVSE